MPAIGPDPEVTIPQPWTGSLSNGTKLMGIKHSELPLVQYRLSIGGGRMFESTDKAGLSNLVAALMNEGTKNKTPEELELAIGLLGASIYVSSSDEEITINVSSLTKNFEKTLALVEEMLLEPRWDEEQFALAKSRIINSLKRNAASPDYLASSNLNKLIFGNTILAFDGSGTEESVSSITIDDLKDFYSKYFSPSISTFLIAGDLDQARVEAALTGLSLKWQPKEVALPVITAPAAPEKSQIYFVDVPGAKQSVINIGGPSIPRSDPDFYAATVANYKLGGSFNGIFNLILREEKGFTYGARSGFSGGKNVGSFTASSRVRTNSTLESVTIFKTEMEKYREAIPQEYVDFTKAALMKGNALRFETLGSLLGMINNISSYNLPFDYIKQEEAFVKELTPEKILEYSNKYIDPSRMYYVVAGDAKTQLNELKKAGLGEPVSSEIISEMKRIIRIIDCCLVAILYRLQRQQKKPTLSVPYEMYKLDNGLTVVLNEDRSDPITSLVILYHVGSGREVVGKTGFAHLFEHMMFQRSENVGEDQFFKYIEGAGGSLNGGTSYDQTIYFEVVPKNALEMAMWLESDRMGYLSNTVTPQSFALQQNVVQNEKRQGVDNMPYGHTEYVLLKNLYPAGHPYSWDVIGEMGDLANATVEDVKAFHSKFYIPNNATLVVSGDYEVEEVKALIQKVFRRDTGRGGAC